MGFMTWLRNFFSPDKMQITLTDKAFGTNLMPLVYEDFAITIAINLIAGAVSKCEFKTFKKHEEIMGEEYYCFNVEPNKNQNSSQFLQELVSKLLYYNECLVVEANGQLIIADDFVHTEYALLEDVFSKVTRGSFTFDRSFRMSEVLYFRLGYSDIKTLLTRLYAGYSNLIEKAIGKYNRSGGRKGILKVGTMAAGEPDFQKKFGDLMNNRFKTYFSAENAVLPLFEGYEYSEPGGEQGKKSANEVGDIKVLTSEAFERVAQAFKIPPALLKGDIADIEKITDNFLTFCIDPLCDMMSEEINRKRYGKKEFLQGSYLSIDTTCIKHIDIFDAANAADKLIACGIFSIDEIRRKLRDTQLNTHWSKSHFITKNYSNLKELEGGEGNE